ncbi:hypothetical protein HORIV_13620 [Vreelandella olivaria]|uniref:Uncharacterized protein n=1 Tax=Vreelandella olivaria TaxID=390919 RepID=A0ABM7GEZ4_9GAMM|nr:hypothetical protein HORIV_13620 [Halomonas olivaria]
MGQVLLAAFPAYAKDALSIDNTLVLQGILAASGIGIALGSMLASKLSHNRIETGLIPVGAVGVAVGLWCLPLLSTPGSQALNFVFIGMMGGLFIVPLNALIQFHAADSELGTVLAANNWIQNIAMLGFWCSRRCSPCRVWIATTCCCSLPRWRWSAAATPLLNCPKAWCAFC